MTGMSVERHPDIARDIVNRGHKAAAHGRRWAFIQPWSGRGDEFIADGIASVERAFGNLISRSTSSIEGRLR
jgi:peptidoglycan/xylan/chitin deacetylase (PgdA/CDA1 family)